MRRPSLLVIVLLAGCLEGTDPPPAPTTSTDAAGSDAAPTIDVDQMLAGHAGFVRAFPNRAANSTDHQRARDAAAGDLAWQAGPVERRPFFAAGTFWEENICRFQEGRVTPQEVVVVFGHYDSAGPAAGQGAYDNGAGFRMVVELNRAFSKVGTNRSIMFCAIDGGDNGYTGSRRLLADLTARFGEDRLVAALVLDGFGLMWPIETPMLLVQNSETLSLVVDEERKRVGVPDEYFRLTDRVLGGRLDAGPWFDANVPVAFMISNIETTAAPPPATGTVPGGYPFLHSGDTVETMTLMAGGDARLRVSFTNALDIAAGTLWRFVEGDS